jgi:hypothetical protein
MATVSQERRATILAALIDGLSSMKEWRSESTIYFSRWFPTDDDGNEIEDHDIYSVDGPVDLRKLAASIDDALERTEQPSDRS